MQHVDSIQREKALQLFNRTEKTFKQDIETIRKWVKLQPHLPDLKMDDVQIGNFLFLNKCSIENTKKKIDMYFTIRTLIPEYFENLNPKLSSIKEYRQINQCVILPKLTKDLYTVYVIKQKESNTFNPLLFLRHIMSFSELRLREGLWIGDVIIIDMENVSFNDMARVTPSFLAKAVAIYQKVFSLRLKAGYIINCKPFYMTVHTMAKKIIKSKVLNRFKMDPGVDCLREILPIEQIPKDYGGEGQSIQELHDLLELEYDKQKDIFDVLEKIKVNESLRPEKLNNDEILGFYGNFQKLDVD